MDNKDAAEYDLQTSTQAIVSGEWERVEATIRVTNGKYLILGVTDLNYLPNGVYYYLDDIELRTPEYVTVRFDTNGSRNDHCRCGGAYWRAADHADRSLSDGLRVYRLVSG